MMIRWCLLLFLLVVADVRAMDMSATFAKLKNCKECIAAGYGWCPMARKCGGFANRECGEGERYVREGEAVPEEKTDCVVLTDENFDKLVSHSNKGALVEFYAPWCGHCKSLKPTYEKVCADFKGESGVLVGMMDATKHSSTAQKFDVNGFPTIKWFPANAKHSPTDFDGARDEKSLVDFINKKASTFVAVGGGLSNDAGRLRQMDSMAAEFMAADPELATSLAADAATAVGKMGKKDQKSGGFYVKTMEKILQKGHAHVPAELQRLHNLITGGQLSVEKKTEFQKRMNILKAFMEGEEEEEEEQEMAPSAKKAKATGQKLTRSDLYKMSYEDLVKKVLEMQENC